MPRRPLLPLFGLVLILASGAAGLTGSTALPADREAVAGEEADADGLGPAGGDQWVADHRPYPYRAPVSLDAPYPAPPDPAGRAAAGPRAATAAAAPGA